MADRAASPPMIESPALAAIKGVRHAFFTRQGGVSEGLYSSLNCGFGSDDDPARVAENRWRAADALGVDALVTAYQVHGTDVVTVDAPWERADSPRAFH